MRLPMFEETECVSGHYDSYTLFFSMPVRVVVMASVVTFPVVVVVRCRRAGWCCVGSW